MAAGSENQYGKKHTWGEKRPKNILFALVLLAARTDVAYIKGRSPRGLPLFQAQTVTAHRTERYGTIHRLVFAIHMGLKFLSLLKCLLNKCS